MAGLDAGLSYNTWPKMADRWLPSDLGALTPKWKNIVENSTTVQFNHRHLVSDQGTRTETVRPIRNRAEKCAFRCGWFSRCEPKRDLASLGHRPD